MKRLLQWLVDLYRAHRTHAAHEEVAYYDSIAAYYAQEAEAARHRAGSGDGWRARRCKKRAAALDALAHHYRTQACQLLISVSVRNRRHALARLGA